MSVIRRYYTLRNYSWEISNEGNHILSVLCGYPAPQPVSCTWSRSRDSIAGLLLTSEKRETAIDGTPVRQALVYIGLASGWPPLLARLGDKLAEQLCIGRRIQWQFHSLIGKVRV